MQQEHRNVILEGALPSKQLRVFGTCRSFLIEALAVPFRRCADCATWSPQDASRAVSGLLSHEVQQ